MWDYRLWERQGHFAVLRLVLVLKFIRCHHHLAQNPPTTTVHGSLIYSTFSQPTGRQALFKIIDSWELFKSNWQKLGDYL